MENCEESIYLTKQILTYMGNKRKCLSLIDDVITQVKQYLNKEDIDIAEGFSGSGIVSRLLKNRVMNYENKKCRDIKTLYVNDNAGYSKTLNECYLTPLSKLSISQQKNIIKYKKKLEK